MGCLTAVNQQWLTVMSYSMYIAVCVLTMGKLNFVISQLSK